MILRSKQTLNISRVFINNETLIDFSKFELPPKIVNFYTLSDIDTILKIEIKQDNSCKLITDKLANSINSNLYHIKQLLISNDDFKLLLAKVSFKHIEDYDNPEFSNIEIEFGIDDGCYIDFDIKDNSVNICFCEMK